MARIYNYNHSSQSERVISSINGGTVDLSYSYDHNSAYNLPPFIWDKAIPVSSNDPITDANLLRLDANEWKYAMQMMSGRYSTGYKEYIGQYEFKPGVWSTILDEMGDVIRTDLDTDHATFVPRFVRLECVYHYKNGSTYRDKDFDTKVPSEYSKFKSPSGAPLPFYFKSKMVNPTVVIDRDLYDRGSRFDTGRTYNGYKVYGHITVMADFNTTIKGEIATSFKSSASQTRTEITYYQNLFESTIDYITLEPVYNLQYGHTYVSGTVVDFAAYHGMVIPAGYKTVSSTSRPVREWQYSPIEEVVFDVHAMSDGGPGIRGYYRYDDANERDLIKYTYVDDTVDYSTAFTTKTEALELFDVTYVDSVVTVSMKHPVRGWMPPYNYSELVSNQDPLCVPFLLLLDDRYSDSDVFNGELMYSDYWRLHPGEQYKSTAYPGHVMGLYHVTHVNNLDGTISFSYPLIGDGEGWPTVPFEGSLALSKALQLGKGSLDAQDQLVPWNCWSSNRTIFLGDMPNFVYTRDDVHLVSGIDAYKGSVNPDNKLAINTQTAFIYKNIDAQYVLTIPLRAAIPIANVADTPGWGYEVLQGTHVSSSVTGVQRVQNSLAAQFVITADALEDTDLEGGNITFKLYKYTGATYDSKVAVAEYDIYFIGEYYQEIVPSVSSVYLTGSSPEKVVRIDTNPATSFIDELNAECSNDEIAEIELDDHTLTITQVATGRCTVRVWSTIFPGSYAMITVISGTTEPGGADDEPDDYTNYPVPTDPEDPLEPEARAQHAYFYDLDWRTSQLKQHCGGFDHGIGRGKTFNAAPGTLYIVYSEHSKREYFRDGVRTEGMEDQVGKYVPTPLLQGDDVWHTDYEAPAFLDTGNIADRNGTSNKRFREVQYVLALDGDTDMRVAFAFLVDGAMRRPMLKPVAEYDPDADVITVNTEYDEPYSVAESTVGNLGEWNLDAHTLENAERVRVRQNVTGKGITASTRIVFKMSGQFKLLGVNYVYREMYSR